MSTDLYGIRIEDKQESTLWLRVYNVYADIKSLPNPGVHDFFVRVLCDWEMRTSETCPLLEEIGEENRWDEDWMAQNASRFIAHVSLLETRNYPGELENLFYYERQGHWQDEEKLPQALYKICVKNPDWLVGAQIGKAWGTTSYSTNQTRFQTGKNEEWRLLFSLFAREGEKKRRPNPKTLDRLRTGLGVDSPSAFIAWNCAERLGEIGAASHEAVPALMGLVTDGNLDVACYAMRALGEIGDPRGASALTLALGGYDTYRQHEAARALGDLGPQAQVAIDALSRSLHAEDATLRAMSAYALYRNQPEHPEALARFLEGIHGDENLRYYTLDAIAHFDNDTLLSVLPQLTTLIESPGEHIDDLLGIYRRLGPKAQSQSQDLLRYLQHPQADTRAYAAELLAITQDPIAPDALRALLQDPSPTARASAADGLLNLHDRSGIPTLTEIIRDAEEADALYLAIRSVQTHRCQEAFAPLQHFLSRSTTPHTPIPGYIRSKGIEALASLQGAKAAIPLLHSLLEDPDVSRAAANALASLQDPSILPILHEQMQQNPDQRHAQISALLRLQHPDTTPLLHEAFHGDDPYLQLHIIQLAGTHQRKDLIPLLKPLLTHPDAPMRWLVAKSLLQIDKPTAQEAFATMTHSDDWSARFDAIGLLQLCAHPHIATLLQPLTHDEQPSIQQAAHKALEEISQIQHAHDAYETALF